MFLRNKSKAKGESNLCVIRIGSIEHDFVHEGFNSFPTQIESSLNNNNYHHHNQNVNSNEPKINSFSSQSFGCDKNGFFKWLIRGSFFAIWCSLCLWQVIDLFKKYYNFPTEVNVIVEEMKSLHRPGITICNNNLYDYL